MRKKLFSGLLIIFLFNSPGLKSQDILRNTKITNTCYAGNAVTKMYIPPPKEFYRNSGRKGGADITVNYTGATSSVVNAVEFASRILESLLPDGTKITVAVTWKSISTAGVLANSSANAYVAGWAIDAFKPFAYYPLPLAEKIYGGSLNSDLDADIVLNINSSMNWYLGTDGKTSSQQYDLVTVVLHELLHGLGFIDSMEVEGNLGYYGSNSVPSIYDLFIENYSGKLLTDTLIFKNPSNTLKTEITSGLLFFNGPVLSKFTGGKRASIYAPATFDAGSSISHLDEETYTEDTTALMTPFVNKGEAIHNPGKFTMSILGDLGWVNTRITHDPPKDTEDAISEVKLSATIISDTLLNKNKIGVVYSFDNFQTSTSMIMNNQPGSDSYNVTIPVSGYNMELQYYIFAEDFFKRMYHSPSWFEEVRYSVYVGQDTVKPVITHTPAEYFLSVADSVRFNASVYDNIGVDTVIIEYRVDNGPVSYVGLNAKDKNEYSGSAKVKQLFSAGGDSLRYRIFAYDKASISNIKILPKKGEYAVAIEKIFTPVAGYSTDFSNAQNDFINSGFGILKPLRWTHYGLHTMHPYTSPEESADSLNFTSILRYPIVFDGNGMIFSYKEVVLVEPGEEGSVFGSENFFDYVIVEGSKDHGKSWFRFFDGYDSRINQSWETAYNSSITDINSNYAGNESMMVQRTFFPKADIGFNSGDTILIRFRLFSDPYANGWGWAIEDLQVGPIINGFEDIEDEQLKAYPNPGNGLIRILTQNSRPHRYSVYDISGNLLITGYTEESDNPVINLTAQPSGTYIIILEGDNGTKNVKYILIK